MKMANFLWILALSAALAAYSAFVRDVRQQSVQRIPSAPPNVAGISLIRLAEAIALWRDPGTLFVDVRTNEDYAAGHIPGAIHLPDEEGFEERLAALRPRLERAAVLVVYCKSVDCGKSLWAAIRLKQSGLEQVKIYPGGWNEWCNEGQPRTSADR